MERVKIVKKSLWQFIKFSMVGASNSGVYLGVFYLLTWLNHQPAMAMVAQAVAWVLSVGNSFIWNRAYVFNQPTAPKNTLGNNFGETLENNLEKPRPWWHLLVKVYLGYGAGLGVSTGLTYLQTMVLGVPSTVVPMVNLLAMGPVNFFIMKYFAFKQPTRVTG